MLSKNIGRLRLELYSSVDELPSERYNKFNIYCLLRAGIGNDAESVLEHMQGLYQSAGKKDYQRVLTQLQNYHHSLSAILSHEDTACTAFACLIYSINGVEVRDTSDEGLKWVVSRVARAEKRVQALQLLTILKKKLKMRLRSISQGE